MPSAIADFLQRVSDATIFREPLGTKIHRSETTGERCIRTFRIGRIRTAPERVPELFVSDHENRSRWRLYDWGNSNCADREP
jgi:hypothetical protein